MRFSHVTPDNGLVISLAEESPKPDELPKIVQEGSISWNTLRNYDLFWHLGTELAKIDPEALWILLKEYAVELKLSQYLNEADFPSSVVVLDVRVLDGDDFWDTEEAGELVHEIISRLESYQIDGLTFSAHPGDGSDFGWWRFFEETLEVQIYREGEACNAPEADPIEVTPEDRLELLEWVKKNPTHRILKAIAASLTEIKDMEGDH